MFDQTHYQCEHRKIFDAYREKYKNRSSCLFEDGIVDPSNYQGILFLLKEAYSKDQTFSEWNLVSNLAEKGPWGMWNHVCMWTHGIEHTTNNRIEPFRDLTEEEKCCALSHLAIINVKKVNGTSTSSDSDLQGYVVENKELLCKEVLGVQPKIIVCGNTFRYLTAMFGITINKHQRCENWYYWLNIGELEDVLVLDYYHPAVQYPSLLTYYGLTNIYQQALIRKLK